MPFHLALVALWEDGGIAAVFNSPYIIPVAGCLMVLGIVVTSLWAGVRSQEMRSQERLAAIARGLPVDAPLPEALSPQSASTAVARPNNGAGARRAGLVLLFVGLGLIAFFFALTAILRVREILSGAAVGLIPALIGVGFLIDASLRRAEYQRALQPPPEATPARSSAAHTQLGPLH